MRIFVIIPAYNEADTIQEVVLEVQKYIPDIIVVDDGSSDQTFEVAETTGVIVLKHLINRGQGAALRTGTKYALKMGADIVVHLDADGQHRAKDILAMTEPVIRDEVDITLGSRFLSNSSKIPWSKKNIIIPMARVINWLVAGLWLTDAHNGWRAMSKRAAKLIEIEQDHMAHNTDIIAQIVKHDLRYKEVAVEIIYREYGQGFRGGVKILLDILKNKSLK